jgi:hypothetical protein
MRQRPWLPERRRTIQERRLASDEQAIFLRKDVPTGRALDRDAVEHGAAKHQSLDRLDFEASADRGVREYGRPALTALREFRAYAEGGVQE